MKRLYQGVLWAALLWVLANAAYVYLARGGAYRLESALWILVVLLLPMALVSRRPDPLPVSLDRQRLLILIVVGLWLAALVPLVTSPFLSDDYVFLQSYRGVADVLHAGQFFRPLFGAVFLALKRLGGGSPVPFHVVSLALHLVAAALAYRLARQVFGAATPALVVFAVFLLNPLQLEATLWVSGLQELLWSVAILGAACVYVGAPTLTWPRIAGSAALVSVGLLSKETAVCFVLLFLLLDGMLFRLRRGRLAMAAYTIFVAQVGAYLVLRSAFVTMESGLFAWPSRFAIKQFVGLPYRVLSQPWNPAAVDLPNLVPFLVCGALAVAVFVRVTVRKGSTRMLMGPAIILLSTLPLVGYFFVRHDLASARYLYFAGLGWGCVIAELLLLARTRAAWLAGTGILVASLALALHANLRPWRAAGDLVATMGAAVRAGQPALAAADEWEQRHGLRTIRQNGIPRELQGVGIFINGYAEFLEIAGSPR